MTNRRLRTVPLPLSTPMGCRAIGITLLFVGSGLFGGPAPALAQGQGQEAEQVDMKEMMARVQHYTKPGEKHKVLERFLGTWDTTLQITMVGATTKPEPGTTTCSWLMAGRWMQCKITSRLMGMQADSFVVLGYDNFKKSFVTMTVGTMDTAMLIAEGDLDPSGKALITYGTLDEYTTGDHDKMVKYVWRFLSPDEFVLEVHDLPIGESNTKVIEFRFAREKLARQKKESE